MQAQQAAYRIPELYAAVILAGLIGLAVDVVLRGTQRRAFFWVGEERARRP
jgi:ABC-type nitrate/sulfonate/bicarbonate transport system permease component